MGWEVEINDFQTLLETIDRLGPEQLEQVKQHIDVRRRELELRKLTPEEGEQKVLALREAIAKFREGLSDAELAEIIEAMNIEYVDHDAMKDFDWIDELPEDER